MPVFFFSAVVQLYFQIGAFALSFVNFGRTKLLFTIL